MWVDANIHATELTASVAALGPDRTISWSGYGTDRVVTEALRTRTFYIVPRVNPDGAELALADRPAVPAFERAAVAVDRPLGPARAALVDVDGDGRILTMRIPDPTGAWMPHPDDARLMVPVPIDGITDAPRYRLLNEGVLEDYDGYTVPTLDRPEGLDLNRNFPAGWGPNIPGPATSPAPSPRCRP